MKRILLDCDGVLADFVWSYLDLVGEITGRLYTHEAVTEFNLARALKLSDVEAAEVASHVGKAGWCSHLHPIDGAIDGVARLQRIADVYIVTSPWSSPTWSYDREKWIARHFGIPSARVVLTSAKHLVVGDVLVDDRAESVIEWQKAHPGKTAVLWEQPWNRRAEWAGVLTNSWDRLVSLVEELP